MSVENKPHEETLGEKVEREFVMSRRGVIGAGAGLGLASILAACGAKEDDAGGSETTAAGDGGGEAPADDSPLLGSNETNMQGKTVEMGLAALAGWPPSQIPVDLYPDFAAHVKEKYGYDTTVTKTEAPFAELFQKIAPSLAAGEQEYNIMVVDSQWLGALSEPGWIVDAEEVFAANPELDLEVYSSLVRETYQVYPTGSGQRWGFPQMPDTQGIFMRLDMLEDPAEQEAFEANYGWKLPTTYEEVAPLSMVQYEDIFEHFTRPDEDFYGLAMQYAKEYDFFSCAYHPYAYATGDIWNPETGEMVGVLNTPEHAEALEYFVSLMKYQPPGAEAFGIGSMIDLFNNEQVFAALQWNAVGLFMEGNDGALAGKVLVGPHPKFTFADGSLDVIGAMGGQPWVLNSYNDDDHMRCAIDFLKWWYTDETQAKFIEAGGLPWTKEGVNAPGFEESSAYARSFKEMLAEGKSRDFWHLPEYAELLAIQQEAYNGYAAGQFTDPKRVLDYIAVKQQELLIENGRCDVPIPDDLKGITLG
ncbi:MAG: extracellular solute-binding protein [Actinomycetota bacterium]